RGRSVVGGRARAPPVLPPPLPPSLFMTALVCRGLSARTRTLVQLGTIPTRVAHPPASPMGYLMSNTRVSETPHPGPPTPRLLQWDIERAQPEGRRPPALHFQRSRLRY